MFDGTHSAAATAQPMAFDENGIFYALGNEVRRALIASLARKGPQPALGLHLALGTSVDTVRKQLYLLIDNHLVVMGDNPDDRRQALYTLTSAIKATLTEHETFIDFGFGRAQLLGATQDADLVFDTLSNAIRRRVLVTLGRAGAKTAADLRSAGGKNEAILKQLQHLVKTGFVMMTENPADRRRSLFTLGKNVTLSNEEPEKRLDFGVCSVRL